MSNDSLIACRAAFEKWWSNQTDGSLKFERNSDNKYINETIELSWFTWQASRAQHQAELVGKIHAYESPELYDGLIPKDDVISIINGSDI